MRAPDGSILPYEKEPSVLAIKVNEKDIEERFIQFQETSFQSQKNSFEAELIKNITYLKSQEQYKPIEFLNTQQMQNLFNYIKQTFSWKTGRYTVIIDIESPEKFTIVGNKYRFTLTPVDIEELEKNKNFIEQEYKNQLVTQTVEEYKKIDWNWRNPSLQKE